MNVLKIISRIFFPEKCPLCKRIIDIDKNRCPHCSTDEAVISESFCQHCGYDTEMCICANNEISLSHIGALSLYRGITKAEIYEFKFNGRRDIGKEFARRMSFRIAQAFPKADFDLVTFVPMTENAQKARGFNQSELLAENIAKALFIPCCKVLLKIKETPKQHKVSAIERRENLKGAFALNQATDIKGKTILLCDDIKTTGNTLKECEAVLLKNGAKDVYCICIALSDYGDVFPALDKTRETY